MYQQINTAIRAIVNDMSQRTQIEKPNMGQ